MLLLKLGALLLLLPAWCFAPGFLLLRRTRWNPLEKLCASVGVSLILLYLASAAIYEFGLPWAATCWCLSGGCAVLLAVEAAEIRRLTAVPTVRRGLYGFAFLLLWNLVVLSMIRHYSGGGWGTDWLEHFQRTLFFLHRFPKTSPLVEGYAVPARPPMMNLLAAFFLAQTGDRFEFFQAAFAFLNLLVFLPCYLIAPAVGLRGRRSVVPLTGLLAASPLFMQNTTYTWTKLLAAFYVILALWFYLRGWSKQSLPRMLAAFVFLAAGMLVHYSTGPYLLFLGLHYLLAIFWRRGHRRRELAAIASAGGVLLATWFTWSIAVYGIHTTVASNTSVTPSKRVEGSNLVKIAANLFDTVAPHPLRADAADALPQSSSLGYFRDYLFLIYQTNAIFGMGLLGGPIVLYLLYKALRGSSPTRRFWLAFVGFCLLAGVAVHGERETFGVAHVTLQPLLLLGLSLLAGSFPSMPRTLAWVVIAGCVLDFALGVAPQAIVESMENTPGETVFAGLTVANGRLTLGQPDFLSHRAWTNWFAKHQYAVIGEWLQQIRSQFPPGASVAVDQVRAVLEERRAQDAVLWHGWYASHGGQMTFLGDWAAGRWPGGIALPMAALLAMFAAVTAAMIRQLPKAAGPPEPARRAKPGRRRAPGRRHLAR